MLLTHAGAGACGWCCHQRLMSPTRQALRNNGVIHADEGTPGPGAYGNAPSAFDISSTATKGISKPTFGTQSTGRLDKQRQQKTGGTPRTSAVMKLASAAQMKSPASQHSSSAKRQRQRSETLASPRRVARPSTGEPEHEHEGSCPGSPHSQPLGARFVIL